LSFEKERLEDTKKRLQAKEFEQCFAEMVNFMGLHSKQVYRAKMKGVILKPFAMKDLKYREKRLPDDIFRKKIQMKFHEETKDQKMRKLQMRERQNERVMRKLKED
jgi:hypothetical protein